MHNILLPPSSTLMMEAAGYSKTSDYMQNITSQKAVTFTVTTVRTSNLIFCETVL
jgi:hypothetical protein